MFSRLLAVSVCAWTLVVSSLAFATFPFDQEFDRTHEATVRITAGNSLGSGCCFYVDANGAAYILTNQHVAGRTGSRVGVEFWQYGKLQKSVPGVVVRSQMTSGYIDVAVVRIDQSALGDIRPVYVPIATPEETRQLSMIVSRGCPGGTWQTQFVGNVYQLQADVIRFYPRPGGGRSGSSMFDPGTGKICALIAWSSGKPNYEEHGVDGRTNASGHGIAMTTDTVWAVLRDQVDYLETQPRIAGEIPLEYSLDDPAYDPTQDEITAGECQDEGDARWRIFRRRWLQRQPPQSPYTSPPQSPAPQSPMAPPQGDQSQPGPGNDPSPDWNFPGYEDDDSGLRDRRRMEPQPNGPAPERPRLLPQSDPSRPGLLRRLFGWVFEMLLKVVVTVLAIAGGAVLVLRLVAPGLLKKLLALCILIAFLPMVASAQNERELERLAERWSAIAVAQDCWYADYASAFDRSRAEHQHLLVIITTDGCQPCVQLKAAVEAAWEHGFLNNSAIAIVNASQDATMANALTNGLRSTGYPVIIAHVRTDEGWKKYARVGFNFGGGDDPQNPSLTEWLVSVGLR